MSAVQNILEFIVVDLIGIVFSAGLCYKMTGFNIFKMLGYLQKEYGLMLTVSQVSTFKRSWLARTPLTNPQAFLRYI